MIKAAFFDLDGTLISSKGTITPAVQNALSQLRKNGILVFAATGRSPYEVSTMDVFSGLEFDAIVSLNGQYCYNRQRVIHSQLFDKDDLIRITQHLQNTPFACAFVEKMIFILIRWTIMFERLWQSFILNHQKSGIFPMLLTEIS